MIPAEAVDAAAKAMFPDNVGPAYNLALRALEAAAPYMLAEAWEEGYTLGYADCANKQESNRPNPYMLNNEALTRPKPSGN